MTVEGTDERVWHFEQLRRSLERLVRGAAGKRGGVVKQHVQVPHGDHVVVKHAGVDGVRAPLHHRAG